MKPWWEDAVIYQIYPLTFADSNGDGVGDIEGIIKRLDYLNDGTDFRTTSSLGVDAIWLSPVNGSPMVDNGYDVSDYYSIAPCFGTLGDFERLIEEAHKRGIRVLMDLVVNHTSIKHPWFKESSSSRESGRADWYHWRDPAPNGGVPNNWLSYFGGPGWTFSKSRGQYYYHTFNKHQPDLNWGNPEVREAIHDVMRFWFDKGVDGFRLDASSVYGKDPLYRDNPLKFGASDKNRYNNYYHLYNKNLPQVHDILREMRALCEAYGDRLLMGETFIDSRLYDSIIYYGKYLDELHLPFAFEFSFSPWHPGYLQREIEKKEVFVYSSGWPTYFLDNHDIPRHLSRWFECDEGSSYKELAKACAALLLTIRGTPVLYYGQEIGMVNHESIPPTSKRDKAIPAGRYGAHPGTRDGCRTPMQWDVSSQAGFAFGTDVKPWLPVHPNFASENVEVQLKDPTSVLSFYRGLLRLRKMYPALQSGSWTPLVDYPDHYFVFRRVLGDQRLLVLINCGSPVSLVLDRDPPAKDYVVLMSTRYAKDTTLALPADLEWHEVTILLANH